ncbi:MAG: hypothetical protein IKX48_07420, partial [Victivallales bacterium]|nr:hypothetical protein [Victivallales bacterium]
MKHNILLALCFLVSFCFAQEITGTSSNMNLLPKIEKQSNGMYRVIPQDASPYQGVMFIKYADLTNATAANKLRFKLRTPSRKFGCVVALYPSKGGMLTQSITSPMDDRQEIVLDLAPEKWKPSKPGVQFGMLSKIAVFSKEFAAPHTMEIGDIQFELPEGNQVISVTPRPASPVLNSNGIPADWKLMGNGPWVHGGPVLMNGRVDFDVSWDALENRYAGIALRFRQTGNNPYDTYVIYCRPMTRSIVADKHVANKASKEFQEQFINFATPPVWQKGKIYKLQIEYVGNTCKVFIDGMLYAYFMDQQAPLDKGELAVMLSDSAKLHKMVVHKYDEKMEVKDAEIQYQTPPERGAVNGNEQAFWGLRTQGEPAIVFDMGKKTFIREIHISYDAVPAQNFTSAILSASNTGKDYQAVCSIPNHFAERVRKACDLSAEVNAVGRYFKLTFQRSKFDNAVEVGSVRF